MARSVSRDPKPTDRQGTTVKPMKGGGLTDRDSKLLRQAGGKQGNQALDSRLQQSTVMRDQLLAFIVKRLETMHQVQSFEKNEMKHEREWFRALARGQAGFFMPDPTRWHEAARHYQRAAQAMCNGNLGHGAALMERAMEAERAAFDSVPAMVEQHLDHTNNAAAGAPAELAHVGTTSTAASCAKPEGLRFADLILNVQDTMERPPPLNRRKGNAWWLEEDEDEEEDDKDK